MNTFENISPQQNKNPKRDNKPTISRRKILKVIAAGAALYGAGKALNEIMPISDEEKATTKSDLDIDSELQKVRAFYNQPTQRQEEIGRQDKDIIGKTFEQQLQNSDSITLNRETRLAIYHHWRAQYKENEINYKDGLIGGLERMKPWATQIKQVFNHYKIPEDYIYLALAESHFDMSAVSNKAAVGPYQITKKTAKLYNLKVTKIYDERRDPIMSAELCAKHLRDSYEKFGGTNETKTSINNQRNEDAWRFALMDYNGGYTGRYLIHIREVERNLSKEQISPQKDKNGEILTHKIESGDTLEEIAIKYHTSVTLLRKINDIHSDAEVRKLKLGKELKIPQKREVTFEGFNAWLEKRINTELKDAFSNNIHKVAPGETLGEIAKFYKTTVSELQRLNGILGADIKRGQKLVHPEIDREIKIKKALRVISSYHENINYPDKFFAIRDIISEDQLDQILQNSQKRYIESRVPKIPTKELSTYRIKKGDTFSNIVRAYRARYPEYVKNDIDIAQLIKTQNNIADISRIRAGQKIHLRVPTQAPPTLKLIAKKHNHQLKDLIKLNPAITDSDAQLAEGTIIRIPT